MKRSLNLSLLKLFFEVSQVIMLRVFLIRLAVSFIRLLFGNYGLKIEHFRTIVGLGWWEVRIRSIVFGARGHK